MSKIYNINGPTKTLITGYSKSVTGYTNTWYYYGSAGTSTPLSGTAGYYSDGYYDSTGKLPVTNNSHLSGVHTAINNNVSYFYQRVPSKITSHFTITSFATRFAFDSDNNIYMAVAYDHVLKSSAAGTSQSIIYNRVNGNEFINSIAVDTSNNLYIGFDGINGEGQYIKKRTPTGTVSNFAAATRVRDLAFDSAGNLFACSIDQGILKFDSNGNQLPFTLTPSIQTLPGENPYTFRLIIDSEDNLYVLVNFSYSDSYVLKVNTTGTVISSQPLTLWPLSLGINGTFYYVNNLDVYVTTNIHQIGVKAYEFEYDPNAQYAEYANIKAIGFNNNKLYVSFEWQSGKIFVVDTINTELNAATVEPASNANGYYLYDKWYQSTNSALTPVTGYNKSVPGYTNTWYYYGSAGTSTSLSGTAGYYSDAYWNAQGNPEFATLGLQTALDNNNIYQYTEYSVSKNFVTEGLTNVSDIYVDTDDDQMYIADAGANDIKRLATNGSLTTIASNINGLKYITLNSDKDIFVSTTDNKVKKITQSGQVQDYITGFAVNGIATDNSTDLYLGNNTGIYKTTQGSAAFPISNGNHLYDKWYSAANNILTPITGYSKSVTGFTNTWYYYGSAGTNTPLSGTAGYYSDYFYNNTGQIGLSSVGLSVALNNNNLYYYTPAASPVFVFASLAGLFSPSNPPSTTGAVFHPNNNIYTVSNNSYVSTVQQITPTGITTTFAEITGISPVTLHDITLDSNGNFYVIAQNNGKILKITPQGVVSTFIELNKLCYGLTIDSSNNLYVTNNNDGQIFKITPQGVSTTFAIGLTTPRYIKADLSDNLYVGERTINIVTKITPQGNKTTFASDVSSPDQITIDENQNIYVRSSTSIIKITPEGVKTTWYNYPSEGFNAMLASASGDLYIATTYNLLKIPATVAPLTVGGYYLYDKWYNSNSGVLTPITGYSKSVTGFTDRWYYYGSTGTSTPSAGGAGYYNDGYYKANGQLGLNDIGVQLSLADNQFRVYSFSANSITIKSQNLVAFSVSNNTIFYANAGYQAGAITIVAEDPLTIEDNLFAAGQADITGVGGDSIGNKYLVISNGVIKKRAAGASGNPTNFANIEGGSKKLVTDSTNNLYVIKTVGGVSNIIKITPEGNVSTFASNVHGSNGTYDIAIDLYDNLYFSNSSGIFKVTPQGNISLYINLVVEYIACDLSGNLYVTHQNSIRRITPQKIVQSTGYSSTSIRGLGIDSNYTLYAYDTEYYAYQIRKITVITQPTSISNGYYLYDQWYQSTNNILTPVTGYSKSVPGYTNTWYYYGSAGTSTPLSGTTGYYSDAYYNQNGIISTFNEPTAALALDNNLSYYYKNDYYQPLLNLGFGFLGFPFLSIDLQQNVYTCHVQAANQCAIRRISPDGTGNHVSAFTFVNLIKDVAIDLNQQYLYVMFSSNNVAQTQRVALFAGGVGATISITFPSGQIPEKIAIDSNSNMYVLSQSVLIKRNLVSGTQQTITNSLGFTGGTTGGMAIDSNNDLYILHSNSIYKVTQDGTKSLFVATVLSGSDPNPNTLACSLKIDSTNTLYATFKSNFVLVKKITPEGVVTTLATNLRGEAVAFVSENLFYVATTYNSVYKYSYGTINSPVSSTFSLLDKWYKGTTNSFGLTSVTGYSKEVTGYTNTWYYYGSAGTSTPLSGTTGYYSDAYYNSQGIIDYNNTGAYIAINNNNTYLYQVSGCNYEHWFSGLRSTNTADIEIANGLLYHSRWHLTGAGAIPLSSSDTGADYRGGSTSYASIGYYLGIDKFSGRRYGGGLPYAQTYLESSSFQNGFGPAGTGITVDSQGKVYTAIGAPANTIIQMTRAAVGPNSKTLEATPNGYYNKQSLWYSVSSGVHTPVTEYNKSVTGFTNTWYYYGSAGTSTPLSGTPGYYSDYFYNSTGIPALSSEGIFRALNNNNLYFYKNEQSVLNALPASFSYNNIDNTTLDSKVVYNNVMYAINQNVSYQLKNGEQDDGLFGYGVFRSESQYGFYLHDQNQIARDYSFVPPALLKNTTAKTPNGAYFATINSSGVAQLVIGLSNTVPFFQDKYYWYPSGTTAPLAAAGFYSIGYLSNGIRTSPTVAPCWAYSKDDPASSVREYTSDGSAGPLISYTQFSSTSLRDSVTRGMFADTQWTGTPTVGIVLRAEDTYEGEQYLPTFTANEQIFSGNTGLVFVTDGSGTVTSTWSKVEGIQFNFSAGYGGILYIPNENNSLQGLVVGQTIYVYNGNTNTFDITTSTFIQSDNGSYGYELSNGIIVAIYTPIAGTIACNDGTSREVYVTGLNLTDKVISVTTGVFLTNEGFAYAGDRYYTDGNGQINIIEDCNTYN